MEPPEGDWLTIAEAARQLGLQPDTLRKAIKRGKLIVRKVHNRLNLVSTQEVEHYRQEHLGKGAWQRRREPGYEPLSPALKQRHYQERKRARAQAQQAASASTQPSQKRR